MVPAVAHATDVAVFVIDGRVLEGELLVVRDTALLIDQGGGYRMWEQQHEPRVVLVPFDSIQRVEVKGTSYLWYGAASGLALGLGIGAAAAGDGWAGSGMVFGGLGGLFVGSAVGASISSPDEPVNAASLGGFQSLKSSAKYGEDEPPNLKKIR